MPFSALIGVQITEATPELVTGRLEHANERCTTGGVLHGGALMALADRCGSVCAFLNLPEGAIGTGTTERIRTSYTPRARVPSRPSAVRYTKAGQRS
jgi:acyl-coenzyme A thioesterase PaaI-like protein